MQGSEDDVEDLLVPRSRVRDEIELEEEEYESFLEREVGEELHQLVTVDGAPADTAGENKQKKKATKETSRKKGQNEDHEFLIKYVWVSSCNVYFDSFLCAQLHIQTGLD